MLTMPHYTQLGPRGEVTAIFCKVCGQRTASMRGNDLIRNPIYQEAKILCDDGSYHVTNGCVNCLTMNTSPAVLDEILDADQEMSPEGYTLHDAQRSAMFVVAVGVGIV